MDFNGNPNPLLRLPREVVERGGGGVGAQEVEVVLVVSGEEEVIGASRVAPSSLSIKGIEGSSLQDGFGKNSNSGISELISPTFTVQGSEFSGYPSPETLRSTPNAARPPKVLTRSSTRRVTLSGSSMSKPKSRFVEPVVAAMTSVDEQKSMKSNDRVDMNMNNVVVNSLSPRENAKTPPITPRTPLIGPSPRDEDEDEDEEIYKSENVQTPKEILRKKVSILVVIEWIAFICTMVGLIASLAIPKLNDFMIWGLELWKWFVLAMVILCGRLFAEWFINFLVVLIEMNFLLRKKVLYFVYGLRKCVQVFLWLGLVLIAWALLFDRGVERSRKSAKVLHYISRALISCLVGAAIWLIKILLVKLLASSFHVSTYFDRIQESIFHQYILQMLSGPPMMELAESIRGAKSTGQLSFQSKRKGKGKVEQEVIDVSKLHKMNPKKVSAWTMKGLIGVITNSSLSTISDAIDDADDEGSEQKEITCEVDAKAAAYQIFRNVAKPGSKSIEREDLMRFLSAEEVETVLPLFEGGVETGKIKKSSLRNWVVKVYLERKSLAYSLNDTKTAVKQLNKLVSVAVLLVIIIVWLLLMEIATTKVLVFVSSQILLVAFMFGNTAKVIFESIIFVFAMHPFDVGDRCVIDGIQMTVEEINILTTIFLRYDNEKIYIPNSVLATKSISNFYRSPSMSDSVEFSIDISTTLETIGALKARIKKYIEDKPKHWNANHSVVVKDIVDLNALKMGLSVTHTISYQNMGEKTSRRSDLVMELKKIFEELSIKYHLLPQEVQVSHIDSAASASKDYRR
ncbi:hypothetical protein Syun_030849 [Stephania yunnanensis]|uniref:Mechanosensitive ion channel protein n=1 Tax=Stephania yunnanensis TaxID=152371 RepID=A0AAP0HG06_9MAGN